MHLVAVRSLLLLYSRKLSLYNFCMYDFMLCFFFSFILLCIRAFEHSSRVNFFHSFQSDFFPFFPFIGSKCSEKNAFKGWMPLFHIFCFLSVFSFFLSIITARVCVWLFLHSKTKKAFTYATFKKNMHFPCWFFLQCILIVLKFM